MQGQTVLDRPWGGWVRFWRVADKPARLVTVALANKAARVVWAIMVRGGVYRMPAGVTTPV